MRTGRCVVREKRGSQQLPPVFPWPGGLSMAPGHNRASPALLEGELSEAPAVWAVEWAWGGRVLSQGRTEVELPLSPDLSDPSPASPVTLHSVPRGTLQRGCRTPDSQLPTVCPQLGPLPLGLGTLSGSRAGGSSITSAPREGECTEGGDRNSPTEANSEKTEVSLAIRKRAGFVV